MSGEIKMALSNYPDGMDWGAYDDYQDPELECGHRANDDCECWCEGGSGDGAHQVEHCSPDNCSLYYCIDCGEEKEPDEEYCNSCTMEIKEDGNNE